MTAKSVGIEVCPVFGMWVSGVQVADGLNVCGFVKHVLMFMQPRLVVEWDVVFWSGLGT